MENQKFFIQHPQEGLINMKKQQSGFTLIELVVVIVLLGILGVTALARFQDLSADAAVAAAQGVASELGAASAINYAEGIIDTTYTVTLTAANVCTTAILAPLFQSGTWPSTQISVGGTGNCSGGAGTTVACTLDHSATGVGTDATASVICGG